MKKAENEDTKKEPNKGQEVEKEKEEEEEAEKRDGNKSESKEDKKRKAGQEYRGTKYFRRSKQPKENSTSITDVTKLKIIPRRLMPSRSIQKITERTRLATNKLEKVYEFIKNQ